MPKYKTTRALSKILREMGKSELESFLQSDTGQLCLGSVMEYDLIQELNRLEIKTREFEKRIYKKMGI
ncbi:MAG: hypothetical protein KJ949_02915 [Nanoarchaeota archaeon]|nr:hypothetical protein [Nanoarchaeota archaeon]MBU4308390.1 hypothetical protein [Nanoarchaeota archaeon]